MKTRVTASAIIKAPAEQVYAILENYNDGHLHILPSRYFSDLQVEQGGIGAGTLIRFQMHVLGKTQAFHAAITEPEPGRVLVETNLPAGAVTTFTIDPRTQGHYSQVIITTELAVSNWLEGLATRMLLQRIYVQELKLLAAYAEQRSLVAGTNTNNVIA